VRPGRWFLRQGSFSRVRGLVLMAGFFTARHLPWWWAGLSFGLLWMLVDQWRDLRRRP
jgi:hypothetical protein